MRLRLTLWWFLCVDSQDITVSTGWPIDRFWIWKFRKPITKTGSCKMGTYVPREAAYKTLVRRYADGRPICGCGEAYSRDDGGCNHGCSANQILTKYEIAERVIEELGTESTVLERLDQENDENNQ